MTNDKVTPDEFKDHASIAARLLSEAEDAPTTERQVISLVSAVVHALLSVAEQVNYLTVGRRYE